MSALHFDEATHTYTASGVVVPSVTQILAPLNDLSFIKPEVLQYKRDLGTAVHKATELYDMGELDESTVSPLVQPYLDGWIRLRAELPFEILGMEERVFHPAHRYAGTYDRLVQLDGKRCIFDLKTGGMFPSYGPQPWPASRCLRTAHFLWPTPGMPPARRNTSSTACCNGASRLAQSSA